MLLITFDTAETKPMLGAVLITNSNKMNEKINALKRKNGIEDAESELAIMINIEAKAMREISKDILNED